MITFPCRKESAFVSGSNEESEYCSPGYGNNTGLFISIHTERGKFNEKTAGSAAWACDGVRLYTADICRQYEAVKYLYNLGARSIGFLGGSNKIVPFRDRYAGYQRGIREFNLPELTIPSSFLGHSFEYGYRDAQELLFQFPNLDAIITSVDSQGLGALRMLKEQKRRVPEDMRVMSLTGHTIGGLLETTMTAMEIPAVQMGISAIRMLLEEIEAPQGVQPTPKRLVFSAELVEREST